MKENERWNYLEQLDSELLKGGVMLSEWCVFITREADIAFCKGANLATIILAVSAIETYMRSENDNTRKKFYELIECAPIEGVLKNELHHLRKYRNKWVHLEAPLDDDDLLNKPQFYEQDLEKMAELAIKILRIMIYKNQWI